MLYLYGDESNTPGADKIWAIGFLFTTNPQIHMSEIERLRRECSYELRELKYSSTDYSQILFATRLIDYFLEAKDLYFKIIVKDDLFFDKKYFNGNRYGLKDDDMAYISTYSELCRSIKPEAFEQSKKLLNIDDKGFKGNVILPKFLRSKEKSIVDVYRRSSQRRNKRGTFTGVSNMIQLADFLTGIILSYADNNRKVTSASQKHKNIYRKALSSRCRNIISKCEEKKNYYWPSYNYQKINIFYWQSKN